MEALENPLSLQIFRWGAGLDFKKVPKVLFFPCQVVKHRCFFGKQSKLVLLDWLIKYPKLCSKLGNLLWWTKLYVSSTWNKSYLTYNLSFEQVCKKLLSCENWRLAILNMRICNWIGFSRNCTSFLMQDI